MPILECVCGMVMSMPQDLPLIPCLRCQRVDYRFEWKLVPATRRQSILAGHDTAEPGAVHDLACQQDAKPKNSYDWCRTARSISLRRNKRGLGVGGANRGDSGFNGQDIRKIKTRPRDVGRPEPNQERKEK